MVKKSKGFMLLETLMVSLTVTGLLIYVYTQYVKINDSYNDVYMYNTANEMYYLAYMRDDLINNAPNSLYRSVENSSTGCVGGYNNTATTYITGGDYKIINITNVNDLYINAIYLCKGSLTNAQKTAFINSTNSVTLKRFISLMENSDEEYRLIVSFKDGKAATLRFSREDSRNG